MSDTVSIYHFKFPYFPPDIFVNFFCGGGGCTYVYICSPICVTVWGDPWGAVAKGLTSE